MGKEPPTKIPLNWDYSECVLCADELTPDNQHDDYLCIACHEEEEWRQD